MVSDSELEDLPSNEMYSYLDSVYQEAKKGCDELGMQSYFPGGVCYLDQFFYAIQHSFIPMLLDGRYIMYRFLSFLPLTLWICYWYYKNRKSLILF